MLAGYNTNISHKDKVYHIQTEDSGQNNPVIVTLLYFQGAILASKKTSYAHIVQDPDFKEKVTKLMKTQHKGMIRELLTGKYTDEYKEEEKELKSAEKAEEVIEGSDEKEAVEVKEETVTKEEVPAHDIQPEEDTAVKAQITKSLDDILLNYIMKRAKK